MRLWVGSLAVSYGVGQRRSSDPALLWLWLRPAATALIGPLVWEPPYAMGEAPPPKKNHRMGVPIVAHQVNNLK